MNASTSANKKLLTTSKASNSDDLIWQTSSQVVELTELPLVLSARNLSTSLWEGYWIDLNGSETYNAAYFAPDWSTDLISSVRTSPEYILGSRLIYSTNSNYTDLRTMQLTFGYGRLFNVITISMAEHKQV